MGYLWISQGIWSILEHLCYSITLRLLDTPESLWITLGYLWIHSLNCGCTVHKVATRALEDVTGGLSLWISLRGHLSVASGCTVRTHFILSVLPVST